MDDTVHIALPRSVLVTLGLALLAGGTGAGLTLGPQVERTALQQCFDNSSTALSVAAQHGEELLQLEKLINEKTADRWSSTNHRNFERALRKELDLIEKRLQFLERQ